MGVRPFFSDKVEQTLDNLQSLSDIIKQSGFDSEIKILKMEMIPDNGILVLENKENTQQYCLYIERLHIVKEKPIALAQIYLPFYIGGKLSKQELESQTVYRLLEQKFGITIGEAIQNIEACPADDKLVSSLQVPKGSPLLKIKRVTVDKNNRPIEKIIFHYRYDEFSLKIKLSRTDHNLIWSGSL